MEASARTWPFPWQGSRTEVCQKEKQRPSVNGVVQRKRMVVARIPSKCCPTGNELARSTITQGYYRGSTPLSELWPRSFLPSGGRSCPSPSQAKACRLGPSNLVRRSHSETQTPHTKRPPAEPAPRLRVQENRHSGNTVCPPVTLAGFLK